MRLGFFGAGMGLLLWPGAAFGQLAFEETVREAKVDPAEEQLEVKFPFANRLGEKVSIMKIESSCGCLQATPDVEEVDPGATGVITGVFSVGARTGLFEKFLTVKSVAGGKESSQELKVKVDVPPLVAIMPSIVSWEVGEELKPKTFIFKVLREKPIRVNEASSSRDGFDCEIKEVVEGREYHVVVTPNSTSVPLMGIVRMETDCEINKHQRQLVYFSVKRASAGGE